MPESEPAAAAATAVYIAREGQPSGPFSIAQLTSMAAQGSLSGSDLAWHEGATGWIPVAELLRKGNSEPAPPSLKKPRPGRAASIIGWAAIPIWLFILVVAVMGQGQAPGSKNLLMMLVGLGVLAMLGANAVGAVLGFIALARKSERKTSLIVGLALNLMQLLGILLLMVIGLSKR